VFARYICQLSIGGGGKEKILERKHIDGKTFAEQLSFRQNNIFVA
jgi:hypothetical protein